MVILAKMLDCNRGGRQLVQDFCSTCAPYPTQLWWVHWLCTVRWKI